MNNNLLRYLVNPTPFKLIILNLNMEKDDIQKLFKKYHEGKCTEEEKALLETWYMELNEHDT